MHARPRHAETVGLRPGRAVELAARTDIVLIPTSASQFTAWFAGYDGTVVAGQNLTGWAQWAAVHDQLPAAVCGSSVSASALQKKVFAADPAAGDPWGS